MQRFCKDWEQLIVQELLNLRTAEGMVIVPVRMTEIARDRTSGRRCSLTTYTVEGETAAINGDLPDERFTLPIESARIFTGMTLAEAE